MPRSKTGEVIQKIKRGCFLLPHPVYIYTLSQKNVTNLDAYISEMDHPIWMTFGSHIVGKSKNMCAKFQTIS